MDGLRNIDWKSRKGAALIAAVIAVVFAQILIVAHAAKYGDGPHEHNGQACVLSLAAPGGDKLISTTAFVLAVVFSVWRISNIVAQTERARIVVRAAKPRGPPAR